jgi:hypothetical protein
LGLKFETIGDFLKAAMETKIQREWCPGESKEIPVDLVETDWGWGMCIDCG